jgi:dTMP kinase
MTTNPHPGKLIVFEGLDGSGQTTQAHLLTKWFSEAGKQRAYYTKEPSEGPVGAMLRLALRHRLGASSQQTFGPLDEVTMALFFAADRADHLYNEIIPKLKDGVHVITDRYYLSSLAYQSVVADYDWIKQINSHALRPDLTIFLDVLPATCVKRMQAHRWQVERYEELRNLERVRDNYLSSINKLRDQGERIEIVAGEQTVEAVQQEIVRLVKQLSAEPLIEQEAAKR